MRWRSDGRTLEDSGSVDVEKRVLLKPQALKGLSQGPVTEANLGLSDKIRSTLHDICKYIALGTYVYAVEHHLEGTRMEL